MLRWWSPWAVLFNDPLALLHISVLNVFLIKKITHCSRSAPKAMDYYIKLVTLTHNSNHIIPPIRSVGRSSPNKRSNHRSPSSFSSANKSLCSTSTMSSRDESTPASRTTSSQSDTTASINVKALKMLTLQKRQLDHLQEQVALLMKSTHTPPIKSTTLDRNIECMREQMDLLERQIDKGGVTSSDTVEVGCGTGNSLILHEETGTNMTQCQAQSTSVQCSNIQDESESSSVSFYLKYKENTDPQKSCNGWNGNLTDNFNSKDVSGLSSNSFNNNNTLPAGNYRGDNIFQHPKIQPPSHSIYNSVYISSADLSGDVEESVVISPKKPAEFSVASRKYLEKYYLREVSPPTKHVDEGRKRLSSLRLKD
eukprot:sb/3465890/